MTCPAAANFLASSSSTSSSSSSRGRSSASSSRVYTLRYSTFDCLDAGMVAADTSRPCERRELELGKPRAGLGSLVAFNYEEGLRRLTSEERSWSTKTSSSESCFCACGRFGKLLPGVLVTF